MHGMSEWYRPYVQTAAITTIARMTASSLTRRWGIQPGHDGLLRSPAYACRVGSAPTGRLKAWSRLFSMIRAMTELRAFYLLRTRSPAVAEASVQRPSR